MLVRRGREPVRHSPATTRLELEDIVPIPANGTKLIVGRVVLVQLAEEHLTEFDDKIRRSIREAVAKPMPAPDVRAALAQIPPARVAG